MVPQHARHPGPGFPALIEGRCQAATATMVGTGNQQELCCVWQMEFAEEDLAVLMKVLVENISEGSKEHNIAVSRQEAQGNFSPGKLCKLEED